jgi:hypothetical protein
MLAALAGVFQQFRLNRGWTPIPRIETSRAQYRSHQRSPGSRGLPFASGLADFESDRRSGRAGPPVDEPERGRAVARLCTRDGRLGRSHGLRKLGLSLTRSTPGVGQDESDLRFGHGGDYIQLAISAARAGVRLWLRADQLLLDAVVQVSLEPATRGGICLDKPDTSNTQNQETVAPLSHAGLMRIELPCLKKSSRGSNERGPNWERSSLFLPPLVSRVADTRWGGPLRLRVRRSAGSYSLPKEPTGGPSHKRARRSLVLVSAPEDQATAGR